METNGYLYTVVQHKRSVVLAFSTVATLTCAQSASTSQVALGESILAKFRHPFLTSSFVECKVFNILNQTLGAECIPPPPPSL